MGGQRFFMKFLKWEGNSKQNGIAELGKLSLEMMGH